MVDENTRQANFGHAVSIHPRKPVAPNIHTYKDSGFAGLGMKYAPGKSRRLTQQQRDKLKQVIVSQVSADVGFPAKFNWTL